MDTLPPDVPKQVECCRFCACREDFFSRGAFDRELLDKVNAENEDLGVDDFRFLSMIPGQKAQSTVPEYAADEAMRAQEQADEASLRLFEKKLARDVSHCDRYLTALKEFRESQRVSKRRHDLRHSRE